MIRVEGFLAYYAAEEREATRWNKLRARYQKIPQLSHEKILSDYTRAFSTMGSIENYPGRKVVTEIDKSMLDTSGHKEEVTFFKGNHLTIAKKVSVSFYNDIDLIFLVWLLMINFNWLVDFD